jgi:hypothetical protein
MNEEVCEGCINRKLCEEYCGAYYELKSIWEEQNAKDKTVLIRGLARRLGLKNAERSDEMRRLAGKILKRFFMPAASARVGYVVSHENKSGEKIVYGDCRKIKEVYKAYLPYDFIITFYDCHTNMLNENQMKVLMLHELGHIEYGTRGWKLRPHDVEDFKQILRKYGLDWSTLDNRDVPDILAGLDGETDEGEED